MQQPASRDPLSIGIIGGGIGGIALALACQRISNGELQATVFEKDVSFNARSQGYGLTVQQVNSSRTKLSIEAFMASGISISFQDMSSVSLPKSHSWILFAGNEGHARVGHKHGRDRSILKLPLFFSSGWRGW